MREPGYRLAGIKCISVALVMATICFEECRKTFKNSEVENFKANQWIDMIIEYQQGKMLLSINGNETVFEHEGVNMDGAKSIVFKYRNIERTLFDYVRLWEITK